MFHIILPVICGFCLIQDHDRKHDGDKNPEIRLKQLYAELDEAKNNKQMDRAEEIMQAINMLKERLQDHDKKHHQDKEEKELRMKLDKLRDEIHEAIKNGQRERAGVLEKEIARIEIRLKEMHKDKPQHPPKEELEKALKKIEEFLSEFDEESLNHLRKMKEEGMWKELAQNLHRAMPHIQRLMELKKNNPKQYEIEKKKHDLERITEKLIKEYRKIKEYKEKEKERENIKEELKKTQTEIFELRQEEFKKRIEAVQKELEEMKNNFEFRQKEKAKIIDKHLNKLLGNRDPYEW